MKELGAFALTWGGLSLVMAVSRASTSEYGIYLRSRGRIDPGTPAANALLTSLMAPVLLLLFAVDGVDGGVVLAAMAAGPFLAYRDGLRFLYYLKDKPRQAVLFNFGCTVVYGATFVVCAVAGLALPGALLAGWSATGGIVVLRNASSGDWAHRDGLNWLKDHYGESRGFGTESFVGGGMLYAMLPVLTLALGLEAAGAYRLAQSILGPLGVLLNSMRYTAVSSVVERSKNDEFGSFALRVALAAITCATLIGAAYLLIPPSWTSSMLGDAGVTVRECIVPLAAQKGLSAAGIPFTIYFKAARRANVATMMRLLGALLTLTLGYFGAEGIGLVGAGIGMATAAAIMLVLNMAAYSRIKKAGDRRE